MHLHPHLLTIIVVVGALGDGYLSDILAASVKDFSRRTGLGITKIYELLNDGPLESITVGKKRLILLESWHRLVEQSRGTPAEHPAISPPRSPKGRKPRNPRRHREAGRDPGRQGDATSHVTR
jgi:hypothetical protein